jgi:SAM-dependent methyltransferase
VDHKSHWENIYRNKESAEMSWTEAAPKTSLDFICGFNVPKNAPVIDIGGGESKLVDYLLAAGYTDVTVLDISAHALDRAKARLGEKAGLVNWITADIMDFKPVRIYAVWHDRAAFHFLNSPEQIASYLDTASKAIDGYMVIGTFSDKGPEKCSGLTIKKYSEEELVQQLEKSFVKIRCITEDHTTPFHTQQNFLFCSFSTKTVAV